MPPSHPREVSSYRFAQRGQVAFASATAVVPGCGVVQIAAGRWPATPGRGAPGIAGADQVDQGAGGVVANLAVGVVAGPAGDGNHAGGQDARWSEAGRPGASRGEAAAGGGEPSGSCSSPGGLGNGSWGMQHRPFGRKPEITLYEQVYNKI